jgi:UDP-glucose 4-epimerase
MARNLGTGKGISVLEMVKTFEKITGVEIPVRRAPRRQGDVPACYADCSKAGELLGWAAKRSLEDMCKSTWEWCRQIET